MLNAANTSYVDNINYYDGIGRPLQTVEMATKSGTQTGSILATLQEYDDAGRETNSWLPTPITGTYLAASSFKTRAQGTSGYSDANPYNQVNYEASPLNRVSSQYGAGAAWYTNSKAVKTEYLLNQASGVQACKYYYLSSNVLAGGSAYYAANTLKVTKVTDEDGKVSYSFVDKIGRKLLERQVVGTTYLDTYYIYDDLGNIRYVLQPMYQTEASLAKYAFQYEYDGYNRCVKKTLPGTEPIIYVYDNTTNQLLYSQDGNQRAVSTTASAQKWTYYKYDAFYRITEQGECTGQNNASNTVVHLKNYYDKDYSFTSSTVSDAEKLYSHGKQTGSVVYVLGNTSQKITTMYVYDGRGRVVRTEQSNILGGTDKTTTTYSHTDKPLTVTHEHVVNNVTTTEKTTYSYDERDRLSTVKHALNGTEVTLANYTYDSFGRKQSKKLHGSATNQLTYSYNIRNWLTGISSSKFTQSLTYNNGTSGYFNGNIQSMSWTANGASHSYSFTYDGANRMLNATHGNNYFTEKVTSYDKNGNITSLQRYGQTGASAYGLLDNLTYTLNGNQLSSVTDAVSTAAYGINTAFSGTSSGYAYDKNGNLTKDSGKGISSITYNVLNLPQVITFTDGSTITYTYTADGTKLRVVHVISGTTTQTDYCGNVIYESGAQKYLLNEVGYYNLASSVYCYYLKDHQGNNRVVINSAGTVKETNHYYPFRGLFAGTSIQPFKYNGKELDTKNGLNWYDYGARHYDATLGRWHVADPLADKMPTWSPYTYCYNNPLRLIDKDGEFPLLPFLIKGTVGAVVDAVSQVTVGMANGKDFFNAVSDIDYASVGSSFVTSAIMAPGMSTTAKVVSGAVITVDAIVDVKISGEVNVVGNGKSVEQAVVDVATSILPGKATEQVTTAFNKAVSSDVASKTATNKVKASLQEANNFVNSSSFQTGADALSGYVGGLIGGQLNESISSNPQHQKNQHEDVFIQKKDVTQINFY